MGIGGSTWEGYEAQLAADTNVQTHSVAGSEEEGTTQILRHPSAPNGFAGCLSDDEKNELNTGWALFAYASTKYATTNYFGTRTFTDPNNPKQRGEYQWLTYADVYETVLQVGNGLQSLELPEQSNIGIFSSNRAEWLFSHFGNLSQSYRTVALYETLGANAVAYIITHAQLPVIIVEKSKLKALFDAVEDIQNNNSQDDPLLLRFIIQIDVDERFGNNHEAVEDADREKAQSFNIELMGLSELRARSDGKNGIVAPGPDDLAYIMYTSGTTGKPKGVMLSHVGFAANVASISRLIPFSSDDRHVSYLPMAHIFETMAITTFTHAGAEVGFFQGDIRKLGQDFIDLRPTMLIGVPRVFSKTYDKFKLKVSQESGIKQYLVGMAESYSQAAIRDNGGRSPTFDSLVWSTISASIGFDRIRVVVSGAAPLSPYLGEFMRIVCPGAQVLQGYAMTETTAGGTVVQMGDWTLGHVGIPVDNCEIRLIDAPECNYFTTDTPCPRGEVQFRGICIMKGYYRNEEATKKTLSEDGWLSTGDIGRINPNGTLSIIDRRKNMFKTSQGEYVAAEKLETVYGKANMVNQIWIYGNSYKSFVVGVVVPDALVLVEHFKSQGWWPADESSLGPPTSPDWNAKFAEVGRAHEDVLKPMILENIKQYDDKLKRFEQVKDIYIEWEIDDLLMGFTVSNDCQTPTQKLRRPQLLNRYAEILKPMYAANGEPPAEHETWGN